MSNDKEAVLAVARKERIPETPQEIIKDPMRLEFLGLEQKANYYETDLKQAILSFENKAKQKKGCCKTCFSYGFAVGTQRKGFSSYGKVPTAKAVGCVVRVFGQVLQQPLFKWRSGRGSNARPTA